MPTNPSEEKWELFKNKPLWDLNSLCKTVDYAADRILDRVTFDDHGSHEHQVILSSTENAVRSLKHATLNIPRHIQNLDPGDRHDQQKIRDLYCMMRRAITCVYRASFTCIPHALERTGTYKSEAWRMAFQDHQAVLASAARYIENVYLDDR